MDSASNHEGYNGPSFMASWVTYIFGSTAYVTYAWAMSPLPVISTVHLRSTGGIYMTSRPVMACIGVAVGIGIMLWATVTGRRGWSAYVALSLLLVLLGQAIVRYQNDLPVFAGPGSVRESADTLSHN